MSSSRVPLAPFRRPSDARCVLAWSDVDCFEGEEYLRHYVSFGDDDGEPIQYPCWVVFSVAEALALAFEISCGLEVVDDLMEE